MFCKYCGHQIGETDAFCPHCGAAQAPDAQAPRYVPALQTDPNSIAVVGFILAFFVAIAGLICSIIGLKRSKELGGTNRGFALAGVIISALEIAAAVLTVVICIILIGVGVIGENLA